MSVRALMSSLKKYGEKLEFIHASEEAKICLNCPLPENECKPLSCDRFRKEKGKLKSRR
jgi:hypothetical protein